MKKIDEGYIKFDLEWKKQLNKFDADISELIEWRDKMHQLKLIGHYKELNIGYGNISIKHKKGKPFIISATQTGNIKNANEDDFCTVIDFDIEKNKVVCVGPKKASSESMTHAAIYEADQSVKAIIHVHHKELWMEMLNKVPTSRKNVAYGTPEMAHEIFRLFKEEKLGEEKIMAMAGHEDGIIAFGKNLNEAGAILMEWIEKGNF